MGNAEKLVETNIARETQNCLNGDDVIFESKKTEDNNDNNHRDVIWSKVTENDSLQGIERKNSLATSVSVGEQSVPLVSVLPARRTLSDGNFPIMANLSDAFDAKWTGESNITLADAIILDSSLSGDAAAAGKSLSENLEEQSGTELTQSFTSVLLSKLGDSAEDFSSWIGMPFFHFNRLLNKNLGTLRFNALSKYTPVYFSFFQELEHKNGPRFLLPVGVNDTIIAIYDDEPSSIISYALSSHEYHIQLSDERDRMKDGADALLSVASNDLGNFLQSQSVDELSESSRSFGTIEGSVGSDLLGYTKAMHVRVSFMDEGTHGKVKHSVTCYYAKHFDNLRRTCCPSEVDFIRSLSRCKKWGAQGGKSNVFFAKSLDDRFIIKQVTKTELESFIKFGPEYFKYLSESIGTGSPTCLAKIVGIYQVTSKNMKGGKESRMDVLVMENLLFGRHVTRLYDLKGSSRSRYNPDSSGNNKVLLDQNLIESMPTSPIFVGNKAKRLLERAVWNDTAFLASVDVMDYSLLVGVDDEKHELVLGIIDFMRQYTWDKHLETWVKASGILGGPKNVSPTVISPKQYKKRFRKAMSAYFLVVPDQWSPPSILPSKSETKSDRDNEEDTAITS
uniref:PIPK domain-containing protein n=1 Tax=Ananas comosus var. bracteatus TaxID=296719 RepID=A0A6V7NVG3_ANACO|nr:unnamed protein product [Ananas comosus var. bracteatus]